MLSHFSGRWRFLAFGFSFAFFSSFGQTSFISVFGGVLRSEFSLSNGEFGALYSVATLASGLIVAKLGGLIDHVPLRRYALAVVVGLGLAAWSMAVAFNFVLLMLAFFLLRLFGQGLMTHVAVTSLAREFPYARGKAIAIATLGHPAGEAMFPAVGVLALALLGWRGAWIAAGAACFLLVLPLAITLLRGAPTSILTVGHARFGSIRFLLQKEMLMALPAFMAGGFISTGIVFHQVLISNAKGWPPVLFATSFAAFGAASIVTNLASGWLIDRVGARRIAPFFVLPLAAGCLVLAFANSPWALFAYMAAAGMTNAGHATITTSLLAESYGTERLGSIRATTASVTVVSTSLSPLLFGYLIDGGLSVEALTGALGLFAIVSGIMLRASRLTWMPSGELP